MTWILRAVGLAMVAAVLVTAAIVVAARTGERPVTEATIEFRFSKFTPGELTVPAGVPITIQLVNKDPIGHEWIAGEEAVHQRHRTGTEPYHDQIPTEVSVRAFETKTTVVTFDQPGDYKYVCHLPGHEQYGMKGTIRVR